MTISQEDINKVLQIKNMLSWYGDYNVAAALKKVLTDKQINELESELVEIAKLQKGVT